MFLIEPMNIMASILFALAIKIPGIHYEYRVFL